VLYCQPVPPGPSKCSPLLFPPKNQSIASPPSCTSARVKPPLVAGPRCGPGNPLFFTQRPRPSRRSISDHPSLPSIASSGILVLGPSPYDNYSPFFFFENDCLPLPPVSSEVLSVPGSNTLHSSLLESAPLAPLLPVFFRDALHPLSDSPSLFFPSSKSALILPV